MRARLAVLAPVVAEMLETLISLDSLVGCCDALY
jgi:hypothetical protein